MLTIVAFDGFTNCVELLLDADADVNLQSNYGDTALMDAIV